MDIDREAVISGILGFFSIPYISSSLQKMKPPLLIHISDTPGFVYPYIFRLVRHLEPEILIHTGDMIDEIKLEFRQGQIGEYTARLKKIMKKMETLPVKQIYIIPGNHDDIKTIEDLSQRSVVLAEKSSLKLGKLSFFLSHHHCRMKDYADYYLFGHSLPEMNRVQEGTVVLNGIPFINIISLSTKKTYTLKYPPGTDNARKLIISKIGI